jgi:hypothetical protein
MNLNEKQVSMTNELLSDTITIREKLENSKTYNSYKESYIKILRSMEKVLSNQPLDVDKLQKDKFGIFRLVTDGTGNDPIEQELMSFLEKIALLLQMIKETSS